ncbi:hypothetical protein [Streptomyces sp. NPDC005407]|uniref:hypothetical protein n=1 Tax=Streptomyces sp. NPDC005407 TaxID=3155340 RepID=UPI0033B2F6FA
MPGARSEDAVPDGEASGEPHLRRALRRWKTFLLKAPDYLFWAVVVNLVTIFGSCVALAAWTGADTGAVSAAAGVPTVIFGALLGLVVRGAAEEVPRLWARNLLFALPLSIVLVWLVAGGVGLVVRGAAVDVTHQAALTGGEAMTTADVATASLHSGRPRSHLEINFTVLDHNPEISNCAPGSRLLVTAVVSGSGKGSATVSRGQVVDLDLGGAIRDVSLTVRLDDDSDPNCELDVSVSHALLHN